MPITTQEIEFPVGDEVLRGRVLSPQHAPSEASLLFLHGAGRASKERAEPLAIRLAEDYRLSSCIFDFSGHGTSSGSLKASSLEKRVQEAKAALAYSALPSPISLVAFSMGGHIALELLREIDVHALLLFYPAVYSRHVSRISFGDPRFSEIIRRDRSWEKNNVVENLTSFTGNFLLVTGERDQIIPTDVTRLLLRHATAARHQRHVVVEGADHLVLPVLFKQTQLYREVCRVIHMFSTDAHQR